MVILGNFAAASQTTEATINNNILQSIHSLIESIQKDVKVEIREVSPSSDYLEGVLASDHLSSCLDVLKNILGDPAKDFGKPVGLDQSIQKAVSDFGGVREDQCLFMSSATANQAIYAALWPWASNPKRITLKIGILTIN